MPSRLELGKQTVPILARPDWAHILRVVLPVFMIGEVGLVLLLALGHVTDLWDRYVDPTSGIFGVDRLLRLLAFGTMVDIGASAWFGRLVYPGGYLLSTFLGRRIGVPGAHGIRGTIDGRAVVLFCVDEYRGRSLMAFEVRDSSNVVVSSHVVDVTGQRVVRRVSQHGTGDTPSAWGAWDDVDLPRSQRTPFMVGLPDAYRAGDPQRVDSRLLPRALPVAVKCRIRQGAGAIEVVRTSIGGEFAGYTRHATLDEVAMQLESEAGSSGAAVSGASRLRNYSEGADFE